MGVRQINGLVKYVRTGGMSELGVFCSATTPISHALAAEAKRKSSPEVGAFFEEMHFGPRKTDGLAGLPDDFLYGFFTVDGRKWR